MTATLHPTTSVSIFPADGDTPIRVHGLLEAKDFDGEPIEIRMDRAEAERLVYALTNALKIA